MLKAKEIEKMPAPLQRAYRFLPARLYEVRRKLGLTQLAVEMKTGIPKETISAYENGMRYPAFYNLVSLAAFYEVSVGWLIGE